MSTKRERRFIKLKQKYDNETLTEQELESLTNNHIMDYCKKVLSKRHNNIEIKADCKWCLVIATYKIPRREISCRDLLKLGYGGGCDSDSDSE